MYPGLVFFSHTLKQSVCAGFSYIKKMAALHFNGKNKQEFLDECANLFKGRYTEEDSTFMNYMNKPLIEPPILEAHASHQSGHR